MSDNGVFYNPRRGWFFMLDGTEYGPYWTRAAAAYAMRETMGYRRRA